METNSDQTPATTPLKHSRAGIASFVIGIFYWTVEILALNIDLSFDIVLFLAVLGIILGLIGVFSKNKKRLFPVLGLLLNLFPALLYIFIYWSLSSGV